MRGGVVSRIDTLEANLNINDNTTNVGSSSNKLLLKGTEMRPSYNSDSTQLALKSDVDSVATDVKTHTDSKSNPHGVTKAQVGLGNVDNTSDANKPISTATQAALDQKQGKLTAGTGIIIDTNNRITATASGVDYWTLSDTILSPISEVITVSCSGTISGTFKGDVTGNADTATLATAAKKLSVRTLRYNSSDIDDNDKNGWNESTGGYSFISCVKGGDYTPFAADGYSAEGSGMDCQVQNLCWDNNEWGMQIATSNATDVYPHRQSMAFRNMYEGVWGSWHQMLNDIGNYNINGNWNHSGNNTFSGTNTFTSVTTFKGATTNIEECCCTYVESKEFRDTSRCGQLVCGSTVSIPSGTWSPITLVQNVFDGVPNVANVTIFGFGDTSLSLTVSNFEYSGLYNATIRFNGPSSEAIICLMSSSGFTSLRALPAKIRITVTATVQATISAVTDDGEMC